ARISIPGVKLLHLVTVGGVVVPQRDVGEQQRVERDSGAAGDADRDAVGGVVGDVDVAGLRRVVGMVAQYVADAECLAVIGLVHAGARIEDRGRRRIV